MSSPATAGERPGLHPPTRPEGFGPPDLLRTIVTNPRATRRWILDHGDGGVWVLFLLAAIATNVLLGPVLVRVLSTDVDEAIEFLTVAAPAMALLAAVLAPILLGLVVVAATLFARLLGGRGSFLETARALAWATAPMVAGLPFLLVASFAPLTTTWAPPAALALQGLLRLATFALFGLTLAEAQRLPTVRGFLAAGLGFGMVVFLLLVLYAMLFALLMGLYAG